MAFKLQGRIVMRPKNLDSIKLFQDKNPTAFSNSFMPVRDGAAGDSMPLRMISFLRVHWG